MWDWDGRGLSDKYVSLLYEELALAGNRRAGPYVKCPFYRRK